MLNILIISYFDGFIAPLAPWEHNTGHLTCVPTTGSTAVTVCLHHGGTPEDGAFLQFYLNILSWNSSRQSCFCGRHAKSPVNIRRYGAWPGANCKVRSKHPTKCCAPWLSLAAASCPPRDSAQVARSPFPRVYAIPPLSPTSSITGTRSSVFRRYHCY